MKETEWAKELAVKLDSEIGDFRVEAGKKLVYANEIIEVRSDANLYNEMGYETDILIFEEMENEAWKPRVVIETKIDSVTTHDSITYSQKAASHKYVHPYLRYGIFLGHRGHNPLPGRLFRHGAHFDFMISWKGFEPEEYEWTELLRIVNAEIAASKQLEEMIFASRKKNRRRYFVVHKPLVTKDAM